MWPPLRGAAAGVAIVATARKLAVLVWHLLAKDEDCRFAPAQRTAFKERQLDRLAGRGTRPSQRGATGFSHDRGRARLRCGDGPHHPPFVRRLTASGQTVHRRPGAPLAIFAEDFQSVRRFAERDHANIVTWKHYDRGSHFSPHDAPDLLLADIREFFRPLR
jgi:hypothetical protein